MSLLPNPQDGTPTLSFLQTTSRQQSPWLPDAPLIRKVQCSQLQTRGERVTVREQHYLYYKMLFVRGSVLPLPARKGDDAVHCVLQGAIMAQNYHFQKRGKRVQYRKKQALQRGSKGSSPAGCTSLRAVPPEPCAPVPLGTLRRGFNNEILSFVPWPPMPRCNTDIGAKKNKNEETQTRASAPT